MANFNVFLKSSILFFFLFAFINSQNAEYVDFNMETYSAKYVHTGSRTQTVVCEFKTITPPYIKVTVTPDDGYETPLLCFSPSDLNCNKDRQAFARRTDGKPASIYVKSDQFSDSDLELSIYLSCAKECKYTLLFEGGSYAEIDANSVFTYVVTNKNREMAYQVKGDADQGFLTIGVEGSQQIVLNVESNDDDDEFYPYNLDNGKIISIPITSTDGNLAKFTIRANNPGDFLTLNVHTVIEGETVDNLLYPNGPEIMGMLTKWSGYFPEECFPISAFKDKFSNINKFYLTGRIHSKYALFWLADESKIYMPETELEIADGQLSYLIETNGKARSVCFEFSYEDTVEMSHVAYSISILEPTQLDDFYNFNPPQTIGEIYRRMIPKGGYAVYAGGKIESTAKRYNFNLYNRKGVAEMFVDECTSYPNCIYTTDYVKNRQKIKRINKMTIYEKEVDSAIEALEMKKNVMVVYCRDDDNENNGYCEFETSVAPISSTISLVQDEKFSKYVLAGDRGNFKMDFKAGMKIQRFTLDIMIHSGDVTFNLNGFSTKSNNLKEEVDISHYKYFLSNKIFYHVNLGQLAYPSLEIGYEAVLNSFFTIQFGINPKNLIQTEETVESGESYLVQIDPSNTERYKTINLKNYRYKKNQPFLANFFALNCEFKVTRDENEISFYDGYAQEILKTDTKGYATGSYSYKIEVVQSDLSNYNHKMCMLYVAGYESKDSEYETEIVVGENVNQQVIFEEDFKTVRFLYPQANPDRDLAIYVNIIDQAYYTVKVYINANTGAFRTFSITRSQIYFISKSDILSYCPENTLCNIIVEATFNKKIGVKDTDEPMIEITIRQVQNTPSYLQKSMAKKDFTCGDSVYYFYTDIGKNEKGDVTVNFLRDFGNVWGRIVRKDSTEVEEEANWRGIYRMPTEQWSDEKANGYTKKFEIDMEKTQECIEGCYLLLSIQISQIGDYVDDSKFYPFSIITRITPNQYAYTDTPKIVIQVNEFIIGNVDLATNERIYQFYEIWFPHDSYRIDFDFQSEVAGLYINVGGTRPTTKNADFKLLPPGRDSILSIDKFYLLQKAKNKRIKIPNEDSIQDLNIVIGIWTDKVDSVDTELFSLAVRLPNYDYNIDIIEVDTDQKVLCYPTYLNDNLFRCLFMITYDEEDVNLNMPLLVYASSVNQSATTYFHANFIDKAYYDEFDTTNLRKETPTLETAEFSTQRDNIDYIYTTLESKRKGKYLFVNVVTDKEDEVYILTGMPMFNINRQREFIFYPNPSTEQILYVPPETDQITLEFFTSSSLIATIITLGGEAEISWKNDQNTIYNLRGSGDRLSLTSGTPLNELIIKKRKTDNPNFIFYVSYYVRDPENNFDEVQYGKSIEIAYRDTDLPVYLYSKVGSYFNDINVAVTFTNLESNEIEILESSPFWIRGALAKESTVYKAKNNPELSPTSQKSLLGSYDPALRVAIVSFSRQNISDFNVKSEDNPTLYLSIEKDEKYQDISYPKFTIETQFSKINGLQSPLEKTYNYGRFLGGNFVNFYRLKKDKLKKYMKIEFAFNSDYLQFAVSDSIARVNNTNLIKSEYKARGKTILTVDTSTINEYVFLNIFRKDDTVQKEKLQNYVFKYLNIQSEDEFTDYKILDDKNDLNIEEINEVDQTTIKCTFNKIDLKPGEANVTYFFKVVENSTHVYGEEYETIAIMESPYYSVSQRNPPDSNGQITLTATGKLSNWAYLQVIAQIQQGTIIEYVAYKGKKLVRPDNGGNGGNGGNEEKKGKEDDSEGISTTLFLVVAGIILALIAGLVVVVFIFQQRNKSLLNQVKHVSFQQNAGSSPSNTDPDLLLQKSQQPQ